MARDLELWKLQIIVITLVSLQCDEIEMSAFFTYSEMKEFVSNVFFINFVNIRSN